MTSFLPIINSLGHLIEALAGKSGVDVLICQKGIAKDVFQCFCKRVSARTPTSTFLHSTSFFILHIMLRAKDPLYYKREQLYNDAKKAWFHNIYDSVAECARSFGLDRRNLANRINGQASKTSRRGPGQRLNEAQELALMEYIKRLDDQNMSATPILVTGAANYILQTDDGLQPPVGKNWFTRFHRRHPELFKTRQRPLAALRKDAYCVRDLERFYRKLSTAIEENGIQPADTWNMDETGFRIGIGKSRIVLTFDKKKKNYIADPDNREYCTAVESVSASGNTIPPALILKGKHVLAKWSRNNNLDGHISIGVSESGYSNDDLAIDWLKHFIKYTAKQRVGRYILLIIDGFGSHMTIPFHNLATAHDILLFKLPAHSTHITQPLDVGVFQPYKNAHGKAIEHAVRNGDAKFSRQEFLAAFQDFRAPVFIQGTIRNAFRKCGIHPLDSEVVLGPMRIKAARKLAVMRPATPPPVDECLTRTPRGPASHKRNIEVLRAHYTKYGNFNFNPKQLLRFLKGSERQSATLELRTRDLDSALKATRKRDERASENGQRISTSGLIPISECREIDSARAKKEAEAAERKAKREDKKRELAVAKAAAAATEEAIQEVVQDEASESEEDENNTWQSE